MTITVPAALKVAFALDRQGVPGVWAYVELMRQQGELPRRGELAELNYVGSWQDELYGTMDVLPVVCYQCATKHGQCVGGKLLERCPSCPAETINQPGGSGLWMHTSWEFMTGYNKEVITQFYIIWLSEIRGD
jgi:hypothetical protein